MSKVKIEGHGTGTGTFTVTTPSSNTDRTITLPDATGTLLNSDGDGSSLTGVGVAGISSSADATAMTITSDEKIGIGETTPLGTVHIKTSDSGLSSVISSGDDLVIENSGNGGMSILNGTSSHGNIYFSDSGGHRGFIRYEHATDDFLFGVADATKLRLTGDGLCFNNDSAAANALDDYEEGTWTPTFSGSHIGSHTLNYATYTKIGRLVTINCYVYNFGTIGGSGISFGITGLPFSQDHQANGTLGGTHFDINASYGWTVARAYNGAIYLEQMQDNGSSLWLDYSRVGANTHVQINLTYETNA